MTPSAAKTSEVMPMHRPRLMTACVTCATLIALSGGTHLPMSAAAGAARTGTGGLGRQSRITGVSVLGSQPVGTFGVVPYARTWGTITGVIEPGENVHGLEALPHNRDGQYEYTT